MNRRLIVTGLLGAVAMFVWSSIAHMALPLGEAGIRPIDNEAPLLGAMRSTLPERGFYLFPKVVPGMSQEQYQHQIAVGPSGLLIYFPNRQFSFGKSLGVELGTELLEALIAVYLLSLTRAASFVSRLGFYAAIGLLAAVATNISYWNWYGFPTVYTLSYMLTVWISFIAAGLVAAGMKAGGRASD